MIYVFPEFDPVLLRIGPLAIHYYALAYVGGLFLAITNARYLTRLQSQPFQKQEIIESFNWVLLGMILGGRIGYVCFYNASYYFSHPVQILYIWQGGMAFHGGMIGVAIALWFYSRKYRLNFLSFMDITVIVAPIGLFLGRISNFINGELWGRATNGNWGVIFSHIDAQPRHPSQLYEAGLEGIFLYFCLFMFAKYTFILKKPGWLSCVFLINYALIRFFVESFRQPDAHIGLAYFDLSRGQYLSLLQLLFGIILLILLSKPSFLRKFLSQSKS